MECFTEFDELQEALKRVRMDEEVMPYYRGRLVENEECYSKIQKLLNAPEMQNSHRYLYDLDVENLTEDEIAKVDELFDLGVKKGFIDNSFEEELEKEENPTAVVADEEPDVVQIAVKEPTAPVPCWTILYSATKNGETKCGECYSNAISVSAAKADCLAKLSRFGYDNVSVLAIEAGDPDCAGKDCCNEDDLLKGRKHNAHIDEEDVEENDMLNNRPHNAHKDELNEDETESDDEQIGEASGNPYAAGMKVVTGGKASNIASKKKAKCVKEDDEEDDDSAEDDADDSAEDTADDSADSDDSGSDSDSDDGEDDTSDDAGSDDEDSDDEASDDTDGDSADDADDGKDAEDTDGGESEGSDEDSDEDSDDEPAEELDDDKKAQLKDEYRRVFKETMLKCGFEDKAFNDLSIDDKVKFFEAIKEKWTKNDPTEFFSTKEADQLDAVVVTK